MLVPLQTLQTEASELGSAVLFAQEYPEWALLIKTPQGVDADAPEGPTDKAPMAWMNETRPWDRRRITADGGQADGWPDRWVAWLRPRSQGAMVLTLGRGPASDVCIDHPSVSVLHLIFTEGGEDHWQVCDQVSSNGTTLNGDALPKGSFAQAYSGDVLEIGELIQATLLSPPALFEVVSGKHR